MVRVKNLKDFLWLNHNRLPTNQSLNSKGMNISPACSTCGHPIEDATHIFLRCPNATAF